MLSVVIAQTFSCVGYGNGVAVVVVAEACGDISLGRRVLQGIGHEVEKDVRHLLAVGDHPARIGRRFHAQPDAASVGHRLEVVAPQAQFVGQVEMVERELGFLALNLSKLQYFAHHLCEDSHVAPNHLHQSTWLSHDGRVLAQLVGGACDECQRCSQLV